MFRATLCPSSGAREYYTSGCCLSYLVLGTFGLIFALRISRTIVLFTKTILGVVALWVIVSKTVQLCTVNIVSKTVQLCTVNISVAFQQF
jgi:hypothetical protein